MGVGCFALLPGELHGDGEPDDAGDIFGAGAAFLFLASAEDKGLPRGAVFDVEEADALGAVDLVAGEAEEVDAEARGADIEGAGGLDGVGVDDDAGVSLAGNVGGLGDGLDGADFVVGGHDGDDDGFGADGLGEGIERDGAFAVDGEVGGAKAFALELSDGVEDGVVLDGGGDDVVPAAAGALREGGAPDGCVIGFGAAGGEDDLAGRSSEEVGDGLAGGMDSAASFLALEVNAGGVAPVGGEEGEHGFDDAGIRGGGRGVVEVDARHGSRVADWRGGVSRGSGNMVCFGWRFHPGVGPAPTLLLRA